jgi:NSS family neurotransmitter:Na+ symporter
MVGAFGGGAFLLVYLVILVAFGIPALLAELTLGRMTQRGPMGAFARVGIPGGRLIGWLLFVTVMMALSYYTVVVSWVLRYFVISVTGEITGIDPQEFFDGALLSFSGQLVMTVIVIVLMAAVLFLGIRRGVERVSKVGMPILFVLLLILVVRSVTLPGAGEGLRYYLLPDFSQMNAGVIAAAVGQVFFSLGLGGTFVVTYASYLPATINLKRTALTIGFGETLASVLAGFVIVPAAVAFGLELSSGPQLTFVTAPGIFAHMPAGAAFAGLFFGLLFFAAFLSDVAAFEVLVAAVRDEFGWARPQAVLLFGIGTLLLGSVGMASLDYVLTSDLLWGSIMQPVGSVLALIALGWVVGRGRLLEEVNRGNDGRKVGWLWVAWLKYVIPSAIVIILVLGVVDLFERFFG